MYWLKIFQTVLLLALFGGRLAMWCEVTAKASAKPRVVVLGVNGAEMDIVLPLLIRGEMPNLARVMDRGVFGKLRTVFLLVRLQQLNTTSQCHN